MTLNAVPRSAGGAKKSGVSRTVLVVIILVVVVGAVVAASLFFGQSLSVTKKNFTPYSTPVSQSTTDPSWLTVANTNGGVTVSTWSQANVLINGTVTARGFGASPDTVTFVKSNSSGRIVFQALFPASNSFFGSSYTVDIHVYAPSSYQFNTVQIVTVNGNLQVPNINATSLSLIDTNGDITASNISAVGVGVDDTNGNVMMNLSSIASGGAYSLTTTNGDINLTLPTVSSCRITANTTNGTISASGLGVQLTNHIPITIGSGGADVSLTTTNGSITVTGK
jgi:DUF4097 and DUF4098 domain-containing protein YvlB